jgi:hypothetical protein
MVLEMASSIRGSPKDHYGLVEETNQCDEDQEAKEFTLQFASG